MSPTTRLFLTAVAVHRELMPMLVGLPDHRQKIRDAFGAPPEGDLEFIRKRFAELDHPDSVDIEAAAMWAWLPADALPLPSSDLAGGCR